MILILGQRAVHRRHEVHHVRVTLEPHVLRHSDGAVLADTPEVVAAEIDEHDVLRAILLGGEELLGVPLTRIRRTGDRVQARARPFQLHQGLRRGAHERDAVEVEKEVVGRGVDTAERPVEREGGYVRRSLRPL